MTIRDRIDYLNSMSATIATQHHELAALQQRVEELRKLSAAQESVPKCREMFKRRAGVLTHSANEEVRQLFSGSDLGR
jgi:hypothetical protein